MNERTSNKKEWKKTRFLFPSSLSCSLASHSNSLSFFDTFFFAASFSPSFTPATMAAIARSAVGIAGENMGVPNWSCRHPRSSSGELGRIAGGQTAAASGKGSSLIVDLFALFRREHVPRCSLLCPQRADFLISSCSAEKGGKNSRRAGRERERDRWQR